MLYHMRRFGDSYWQLDRAVLRWDIRQPPLLDPGRTPAAVSCEFLYPSPDRAVDRASDHEECLANRVLRRIRSETSSDLRPCEVFITDL